MEIRLIDAEALVRAIYDLDGIEGHEELYYRIANMVVTAPTIVRPNNWMSVEALPPDPGKDVLLLLSGEANTMTVGGRYPVGDGWYVITGGETHTGCDTPPTHWMPLPAPPERLTLDGKEDSWWTIPPYSARPRDLRPAAPKED